MTARPIRHFPFLALALCALLAPGLAAPPAAAQKTAGQKAAGPPWAKAAFRKYIDSVRYVSILKRAVEVADGRNRPACYGRTIERPYTFRIETVRFNPRTRRPAQGYWRETVTVKGCDKPLAYPVWMFLVGKDKLYALAVVPGRTEADAYQMRAGIHAVLRHAGKAVLGCDRVRFLDSAPAPGPGPSKPGEGPWQETWQISACGRNLAYDVTFTPAANPRKPRVGIKLQPAAE